MRFVIEVECGSRMEFLGKLAAYILEAFRKPNVEPKIPGVVILGGDGGGPG